VPVWSVSGSFRSGVANVEAAPRCNINIICIYIHTHGGYILSICSDIVGGEQGHPGRAGGRVVLLSGVQAGGVVLEAGARRGSCIALKHVTWAQPVYWVTCNGSHNRGHVIMASREVTTQW
jgi:hypothetical protein